MSFTGNTPNNPPQDAPAPAPQAPAANPDTMSHEDFQRFFVQAVVNLGSRSATTEHVASQQLKALEILRVRLQEQADRQAEFANRLAQQQSSYAPNSSDPSLNSASTGTSTGPRGSVKVEVRKFNGQANQVVLFLRELDTAIYLMRGSLREDCNQSMFLVSRLGDGAPTSWYQFIQNTKPELFNNYKAFVAVFTERFQDPDLPRKFMVKLEKLTQTGSAASYANTFLEYLSYLNWSDEHLKIVCFDQGLKPDVQRELLLSKRPVTLHEWVPVRTHRFYHNQTLLGRARRTSSRPGVRRPLSPRFSESWGA